MELTKFIIDIHMIALQKRLTSLQITFEWTSMSATNLHNSEYIYEW